MHHTVTISGLAHGGGGVTRIDGQVCFVAQGLPGDVLKVVVERRSRGVLWAHIEEILEPSPERIAAPCPAYGSCGGCGWLHFAYPAQAEWKRRIVADSLERIGGIQAEVIWVEDAALRLGYRTRAEFHNHDGHWGFFERGSHKVVPLEACPLCHEHLNAALARLQGLRLPHPVQITVNPEGPEVLAWSARPSSVLREQFPIPSSGELSEGFLFDGVPVVNGTFTQASLLLNRLLLREVHGAVEGTGPVLDLYCGNGNLSLGLAARGLRVAGLDHNRAAVSAANAVSPGSYRSGGEAEFVCALDEFQPETILLDPPRTGAKAIADALAECEARRIIYVSCDPATLARDIKVMLPGGWHIAKVTALDLFPHTAHVETVCVLER